MLTLEDAILVDDPPQPVQRDGHRDPQAMYVADDYAELGMAVADLDACNGGLSVAYFSTGTYMAIAAIAAAGMA